MYAHDGERRICFYRSINRQPLDAAIELGWSDIHSVKRAINRPIYTLIDQT